jgi:hypothetical protein
MVVRLGDGDAMNSGIELPVTGTAEPVPIRLPDQTGSGVVPSWCAQACRGSEPVDVGGLANQLGGGDGRAAGRDLAGRLQQRSTRATSHEATMPSTPARRSRIARRCLGRHNATGRWPPGRVEFVQAPTHRLR